tara:strand:+ start:262 stop:642 length:381 start_codon:yes stop_codon:yes gene_type:complete
MSNSRWIPEIMYEESDEGSSSIPFIMVPSDEKMPELVYIFESRETGETEPGRDGEEMPVVQWDLHQYADMMVLKERLSHDDYDTVRVALGLEPMMSAVQKGQKITSKIRERIDEVENASQLLHNKD